MPDDKRPVDGPVVILGAGVNGCCVARELLLNGIPVWLVDKNDLAYGATSKSSRLIHGGLRYLEYGDFRLVRESLAERSQLRKLAPQFVEPLRLHIPVSRRWAGLMRSMFRFLGGSRIRWPSWLAARFQNPSERGLWLVRAGLWLYDRFAKEEDFPEHRVVSVQDPSVPQVDAKNYRWLCSYTDAQMRCPERFVVSLVEDARQLAKDQGIEFRILPYHRASLDGRQVQIHCLADGHCAGEFEPALIINATGAWGDLTLEGLEVSSKKLFGGTKGSHFITHSASLLEAVGKDGLYAEAADGRLIFVLPFGDAVLVGTTDERFDKTPAEAIATPKELDYLLSMVNELFPGLGLTDEDIDLHYSGVRPLPRADSNKTASISRDHFIKASESEGISILTLVGGKLTTARSFAELVAERVLHKIGRIYHTRSCNRVVPGGKGYPSGPAEIQREQERIAEQFGLHETQVRGIWSLCGNRVEEILAACQPVESENLDRTDLPISYARWVIEHEWVTSLDDLVERRLMLLYHPALSKQCLRQLAELLAQVDRMVHSEIEAAVASTIERLATFYGKSVKE